MKFIYSADGEIVGLRYKDKSYYYIKNLQGDVIGILDELADIVCDYHYDAWGQCTISIPVGLTDDAIELANKNPIRYRGYYYDTETELYYLQSRYYNPEWGRFVNGDGYASTGIDATAKNMFAYCLNNPVNYVDYTGTVPDTVLIANAKAYAAGGNVAMCGSENNLSYTIGTRTSDLPYSNSLFTYSTGTQSQYGIGVEMDSGRISNIVRGSYIDGESAIGRGVRIVIQPDQFLEFGIDESLSGRSIYVSVTNNNENSEVSVGYSGFDLVLSHSAVAWDPLSSGIYSELKIDGVSALGGTLAVATGVVVTVAFKNVLSGIGAATTIYTAVVA